MSLALLADHLLNFVWPALWLAGAMVLLGRWVAPGPARLRWPARFALHAALGTGVLAAGLVVTGQDGRMATWAALVLVAGTTEWALRRPARAAVASGSAPADAAGPPATAAATAAGMGAATAAVTPAVQTGPPGR